MSQPKRKLSETERRQRRQRTFNRLLLVAVLVIMIIVTVYAFTQTTFTPLPGYLNRCVPLTGNMVYDSRPQLQIIINGENQTIPARIGIAGTCVRPINTLTTSGTIHVRTDENRTYTLGDFFLVWGNTYGSAWGTFSENQIFNYRTDATNKMTMKVNGEFEGRFQNYPFPRDANTTSNWNRIVITYGPA